MPLGIISDLEFEQEINNSVVPTFDRDNFKPRASIEPALEPVKTGVVLEMPSAGRISEVKNVPHSLRKILGETVATEGLASAKQLAEQFGGISQPTLSTYANGKVSPNGHNKQDDDMFEYVNGRKIKITKRALNKLNLALSFIDEQKLMGCDAKELSSVAKDMAQVVNHMEPTKKEDERKDPVQFHFYAPQVKTENHYEVITAKDNY